MTEILGIDPGTAESGWCLFDGARVIDCGVLKNEVILCLLGADWRFEAENIAIEMVASYGMAVGREVFETCVWVGRFQQAWRSPDQVRMVYRREVKQNLCGNQQAKDANIRQALLDRIGPRGTKKAPGPTYGVSSHAWSALAVAVTAHDTPWQMGPAASAAATTAQQGAQSNGVQHEASRRPLDESAEPATTPTNRKAIA